MINLDSTFSQPGGNAIVSHLQLLGEGEMYSVNSTVRSMGGRVLLRGDEADWLALREKLRLLELSLPCALRKDARLETWFRQTEKVFTKLVDTYRGGTEQDLWEDILDWLR